MHDASIIIPCFDAKDTVESAVGSALAQTDADIEVICIDDGSTDGTLRKLRDLAEKDERIRLSSGVNAGPGAARNTGIEAADGEWLVFLDADDTLEPNAVERIVAAGEATGADVVVFRDRLLDAWGEPHADDEDFDVAWLGGACELVASEHPERILNSFGTGVLNKAFRASFVQEQGLRMERRYHAEALVFSDMALVLARKVALLDEELYVRQLHASDQSPFSREAHPLEFYHALLVLRGQLEDRDLWDLYHDSFVNLAERLVAENLYRAPSYAAFAELLGILQREGSFLLDLGSLEDASIQDHEAHELCRSLQGQSVGEVFYGVFDHARTLERSAEREVARLRQQADELEARAAEVSAAATRYLDAQHRVWDLQASEAVDARQAANAAEAPEDEAATMPDLPEPEPVELAEGEGGRVITGARHHSRFNPDRSLSGALKAARYFFTGK
jgi:glycosyltransferase involved in cell wall biosynthesis